ncbi:MAG: AvaI/BsoBI family type II restriction endonuclease [Candidatus Zixiibacteriota bacterium]
MTLSSVRSSADLVTSHRAVCDGFLLQALTKTQKATPYTEKARDFFRILSAIQDISGIGSRADIQEQLLFAAGFSDKARSHLTGEELSRALQRVLESIASHTPDGWREELVYRYLLTRGDSLGGSMRNITGALAGKQFSEAVIGALHERGVTPSVVRSSSNRDKIQSIAWQSRLLLFDKKPIFIGKNIDVILVAATASNGGTEGIAGGSRQVPCMRRAKGRHRSRRR